MEIKSDMRQEEFLKCFQETLAGKVSDRIIQENVNYYRNYINNEVSSGKSEEEVLISLGDPRLLAKTIEESNKYANGDESYATENDGWNFQGNKAGQNAQEHGYVNKHKSVRIPGWLAIIIGFFVFFIVIRLAFSILSVLAPIILVAVVGLLVYRVITGGNGRSY